MMRRSQPSFIVEKKRVPRFGASGAIGVIASIPRGKPQHPPRPVLTFAEASGHVDVILGVVCVGAISVNPSGGERAGFFWTCSLPGAMSAPRPARDLQAAKKAARDRVAEWFEATGDLVRARVLREART